LHRLTLGYSPSGDDTGRIVSNGSARNTDRLHVVVERQRPMQAHHGNVIARFGIWVALVRRDRYAIVYLTMRIRRLSTEHSQLAHWNDDDLAKIIN